MKTIKQRRKLSKYEYALMCMVLLVSLLCWGFWEMVFSVLGIILNLFK